MASSPTAGRDSSHTPEWIPLELSTAGYLDSLEYCVSTGTYRGILADDCRSQSMAIAEAVGLVTGRAPSDLPPLAERNAPEAIDHLFSRPAFETAEQRLTFQYDGFSVTLYGDRTVELHRR